MKKFLVFVVALVAVFGLASCQKEDKVLESKDKAYYTVGQFNGWGDGIAEGYQMEAIKISDERVKSIKGDLKGVEVLYIKEVTFPAEAAGWENKFTIDGVEVTFDGNQAIKVVRTAKDDKDVVDFWAQAKESGAITNLTPDTLFMPKYVEENEAGDGTWGDNPFAKAAGTYYVVFAEKGKGASAVRMMGLIKK